MFCLLHRQLSIFEKFHVKNENYLNKSSSVYSESGKFQLCVTGEAVYALTKLPFHSIAFHLLNKVCFKMGVWKYKV